MEKSGNRPREQGFRQNNFEQQPERKKMAEINFDDVSLYDSVAKAWATEVQSVSKTQMRRLFDEIKQYKRILEFGQKKWDDILPLIKMQKSKATYTITRAVEKDRRNSNAYFQLKDFIVQSIDKIKNQNDYERFCLFFEAMYGFYYENAKIK